jgi:hypothetical protein
MATSRTTGLLPRRIVTSSPRSARATSFDSCVLASLMLIDSSMQNDDTNDLANLANLGVDALRYSPPPVADAPRITARASWVLVRGWTFTSWVAALSATPSRTRPPTSFTGWHTQWWV